MHLFYYRPSFIFSYEQVFFSKKINKTSRECFLPCGVNENSLAQHNDFVATLYCYIYSFLVSLLEISLVIRSRFLYN